MLRKQRRWSARLMMTVPFSVFVVDVYGAIACAGVCGAATWWAGAVVVSCFFVVAGLAIGSGLTRGSDFAVTLGIAWAVSIVVGAGLAVGAALLGIPSAGAVVRTPLELVLHSILAGCGVVTLALLIRVYRGEATARMAARASGARRREGLW